MTPLRETPKNSQSFYRERKKLLDNTAADRSENFVGAGDSISESSVPGGSAASSDSALTKSNHGASSSSGSPVASLLSSIGWMMPSYWCTSVNSMKVLVLIVLSLQNSMFTVLRRYSQGVLLEKYSKYEVLLGG